MTKGTPMKGFLNTYLYTNIHIAIASVAFCLESFIIHDQSIDIYYCVFLFFGTLTIYTAHRIIGLKKSEKGNLGDRYAQFKKLIPLKNGIVIFSIIMSIFLFFNFDQDTRLKLMLPLAISALYILPILKTGKRLRDLPYIKIFIIAFIWVFLCYYIPVDEPSPVLIAERLIFMLAITIPFDVRDFTTDQQSDVATLVSLFGEKKALILAKVLIVIAWVLSIYYLNGQNFPTAIYIAYSLIYIISILLIYFSYEGRKDEYFTGLLDGTLILRGIMILPFIN